MASLRMTGSVVPTGFKARIERELLERFGRDALRSVKVEFASAGASSVDYDVIADFDGSLAPKKNVIQRLLQSLCVEVCHENGWEIPFTQITVHGVGGEAE